MKCPQLNTDNSKVTTPHLDKFAEQSMQMSLVCNRLSTDPRGIFFSLHKGESLSLNLWLNPFSRAPFACNSYAQII